MIQAAWSCDDGGHDTKAASCRSNAADLVMIAEDHGQSVGEQDGVSVAILVDLLRRSGRIDEARKVIGEQQAANFDEVSVRVLGLQRTLSREAIRFVTRLPKHSRTMGRPMTRPDGAGNRQLSPTVSPRGEDRMLPAVRTSRRRLAALTRSSRAKILLTRY